MNRTTAVVIKTWIVIQPEKNHDTIFLPDHFKDARLMLDKFEDSSPVLWIWQFHHSSFSNSESLGNIADRSVIPNEEHFFKKCLTFYLINWNSTC